MAKIGRPKGAKNKPKWLKELEARKPKRPRGRPKGSKNKPKTLESFVAANIDPENVAPPELLPKRKYPNRFRPQLNDVPPEVRRERARKGAKARWAKNPEMIHPPLGWTHDQYVLFLEEAKREAKRIIDIMADEGRIPDDPEAKEAMTTVLALMRGPGSKDFKLKAARTVLEWTKSKPIAKHDHTIRTAEDFLDDLANSDEDETTE